MLPLNKRLSTAFTYIEDLGRHFSFFQGGGVIVTDFLGEGAKYEKN